MQGAPESHSERDPPSSLSGSGHGTCGWRTDISNNSMPYEIIQVINVWELNGKCIIKFANAYLAQLFGHGADSNVGLEEAKVPQVPFLTPGPTCRHLATLLPEQSPTHGPL